MGNAILDSGGITGASAAQATKLPRAMGQVALSAKATTRGTVLDRLRQSGSSKALLPRGDGDGLTAVLLNTAGGVTGGDHFRTSVEAGVGTQVTLTTQASERGYRALPGQMGSIESRLRLGTGAKLHWLPQETILYDGAALSRRLEADLTEDASFLAVESFILGRAAHDETVRDLRLSDHWRVRRNGKVIYADALRIQGDPSAITTERATLGGHRAFASILLAAPDADVHLTMLRSILSDTGGASLIRNGILAARLTAPDGFSLRKTLIPALEFLRGAKLPRPWSI